MKKQNLRIIRTFDELDSVKFYRTRAIYIDIEELEVPMLVIRKITNPDESQFFALEQGTDVIATDSNLKVLLETAKDFLIKGEEEFYKDLERTLDESDEEDCDCDCDCNRDTIDQKSIYQHSENFSPRNSKASFIIRFILLGIAIVMSLVALGIFVIKLH